MKAYFKAIILSMKTYENILKFNFPRAGGGGGAGGGEGIRHIDCLGKFFIAVSY